MKRVIIIGRFKGLAVTHHNDLNERVQHLISVLKYRGYQVVIDQTTYVNFAADIKESKLISTLQISNGKDCDFAIVVGGDGTMVGASRDLASVDMHVKLIGINAGRLGFITDLPKDISANAVCEILEGSYQLEERRLITCCDQLALNDIVFKSSNGRVMDFCVAINGAFAYQCRADGLLICTPTGSTAYNCSANGAILFPTARVLEIVPLLPQTLSHRPLVINDDAVIDVVIKTAGNLYVDGVDQGELNIHDPYRVTLAKETVHFCHPVGDHEYDFFATLRTKLHWYLEPGTRP
jgi:NAD+ kinase